MPKYYFKNKTNSRLHVPTPVNVFMEAQATLIVEVPAASMENAGIKAMVGRGLLDVAASDDLRLNDHLEVPVLSMIKSGVGAPADASYLTLTANSVLTNERTLATDGAIVATDGGPNSNVTLSLSLTGVVPNTYGAADKIPVITVDAKGRVTNVTLVNNPTIAYLEVSNNYATTLGDVFIAVNASAGPVTVTLHAANLLAGKRIHVKKIDQSSNYVTVTTTGTDLVDGNDSFRWKFPLNAYIFAADGVSKWWIT